MNTHVATLIRPTKSLYLTVGLVVFFGLIFMYMYFLTMSVVHVVLRKEVMTNMHSIESDIAMLESHYIEAQHIVSDKIATLEDFTANDNKVFLTRGDTPTLVLSNGRQ
jgi:hypothetical protein